MVETALLVSNLRDDYSVKMVFLPRFSPLGLSQLCENKRNNIKTTRYLLVYTLFILTDRKVLKLQLENPDLLSILERCEAFSRKNWSEIFYELTTDVTGNSMYDLKLEVPLGIAVARLGPGDVK